jgi:hypothetical protein
MFLLYHRNLFVTAPYYFEKRSTAPTSFVCHPDESLGAFVPSFYRQGFTRPRRENMNVKDKIFIVLIVLGMSVFCGFVGIAGLGSFFPPLNQLAKPFVCSTGVMQVDQHAYSYKPGSTSYTNTVYCVYGKTGIKKDVTKLVGPVIGLISSAILLVPFLFLVFGGINKIRQNQAKANY